MNRRDWNKLDSRLVEDAEVRRHLAVAPWRRLVQGYESLRRKYEGYIENVITHIKYGNTAMQVALMECVDVAVRFQRINRALDRLGRDIQTIDDVLDHGTVAGRLETDQRRREELAARREAPVAQSVKALRDPTDEAMTLLTIVVDDAPVHIRVPEGAFVAMMKRYAKEYGG